MTNFDTYVGLPFKAMGRDRDGLDCYGLVRLVLAEQTGIVLPRYDDEDAQGQSILAHSGIHRQVQIEEAQALDCAIIFTVVKIGGQWKSAPCHIGIFVDAERILHIEEGYCSRVEEAKALKIHSIVRPV